MPSDHLTEKEEWKIQPTADMVGKRYQEGYTENRNLESQLPHWTRTCHFPGTITFSAFLLGISLTQKNSFDQRGKNDLYLVQRDPAEVHIYLSVLKHPPSFASTFQLLCCFSGAHLTSSQILFCKCLPLKTGFLSFLVYPM